MPAKAKNKSKKDELLADLGDDLTDARSGFQGGVAHLQAMYDETGQLVPDGKPAGSSKETKEGAPSPRTRETKEGSKSKKKAKKGNDLEDLGDDLADTRSGYQGGTAGLQAMYDETTQLLPPSGPAPTPSQQSPSKEAELRADTPQSSPKKPAAFNASTPQKPPRPQSSPRKPGTELVATEPEPPIVVAEKLPDPDMSHAAGCCPGHYGGVCVETEREAAYFHRGDG
jgi:hypothetical protein